MSENKNKKIIKISSDFFSDKTKTQKFKKPKINTSLLINPNILKKNLLNRIKDFKNKEDQNKSIINSNKKNEDIGTFTDEFKESINYLDSLSKQKKIQQQKQQEQQQQRKQMKQSVPQNLAQPLNNSPVYKHNNNNNSLKKYNISSHFQNNSQPNIYLELPEELNPEYNNSNYNNLVTPIQLKINDVPYGCLKNGNKPTYRSWQNTQKNYTINDPIQSYQQQQNPYKLQNTGFTSQKLSDREQKLELIREKLKIQQSILRREKENNKINGMDKNIDFNSFFNEESRINNIQFNDNRFDNNVIGNNVIGNNVIGNNVIGNNGIDNNGIDNNGIDNNGIDNNNNNVIGNISNFNDINSQPVLTIGENINTPNLIEFIEDVKNEPKLMCKKTIKRKYTLGKSLVYKKVGILIKDRHTRKKIINAHKEMKKKPLNDIKIYLKEHGLIKVGSNAPTDVMRKIYESAMLTGDIINNNKEVLLHNFLQEKDNIVF